MEERELCKMDMAYLKREFVKALKNSIKEGDGILLSGGLDTSSIAVFLKDAVGITVCFERGCDDLKYAKIIARKFGIRHRILFFDENEAKKIVREVIKILKSFDPGAVRNGIPIYLGIKEAKEMGLKSVITGDGGDELFAGYSFLFNKSLDYVDRWTKNVSNYWHFDSVDFGERFGIEILQPYTSEEMIEFSKKIPAECKIGYHGGKIYGKYIVRKVMEDYLPSEIVWREKHPIEAGSGSSYLSSIFKEDPEKFDLPLWNGEHAYYYKIYREIIGEIPKPKEGEYPCPVCGAGIPKGRNHCRVCGWFRKD